MSKLSTAVDKVKRVDLSDQMSDSFYSDPNVHKGMILGFQKDGQVIRYKIVRLNRKLKKCEAVEVKLYREDEVEIVDA